MVNRSPSLSRLIDQAVAGDPEAIQNVLKYLNAANPDLRHMMQNALHATYQARLWEQMLHCIAYGCWPAGEETPQAYQPSPAERKKADFTVEANLDETRALHSIIETFVVDTSKDSSQEVEAKLAALLPALTQADRRYRWAAAYILGLRGNERALPELDAMIDAAEEGYSTHLSNQEKKLLLLWELRAVEALATLNLVPCGPPLIKALASKQREVHIAAGQALADLGRLAEPALMAALHHADPHVRWHAARSLGQIGDLLAVDTLAEGLLDEKQEVRWATARVLANLDGPAIPAILKVLTLHPLTEPLRQSAYHALNSMSSSPSLQEYLHPLLDVLRRQSAISTIAVEAPAIAQHMLADWKNVEPLYTSSHKEQAARFLEIT